MTARSIGEDFNASWFAVSREQNKRGRRHSRTNRSREAKLRRFFEARLEQQGL